MLANLDMHIQCSCSGRLWFVQLDLAVSVIWHILLLYYIKYFSERQFSYIVHILTWRAQKMHSATSSEGPDWSEL